MLLVLCSTSSYRFHISSGYIWERKREMWRDKWKVIKSETVLVRLMMHSRMVLFQECYVLISCPETAGRLLTSPKTTAWPMLGGLRILTQNFSECCAHIRACACVSGRSGTGIQRGSFKPNVTDLLVEI